MSNTLLDGFRELSTYNSSDFKRLGSAPKPVKIIVIVFLCLAVLGLGFWLFILPAQEKHLAIQAKEKTLRDKFINEQAKVANLDAYKQQMSTIEESFSIMLRQLPNQMDIESLLIDLSQAGAAAGLDIERFEPEPEQPREFYSAHPISLEVSGSYHQLGDFISSVSALPRIVTFSNMAIKAVNDRSLQDQPNPNEPQRLQMTVTATTYRYLEEETQ